MADLDQLKDLSPTLAADLAADIYPAPEVFRRHGLDDADAKRLMSSEWFRHMIREAQSEWASVKNSKERLRIKGRVALEEAIPIIFSMISDDSIAPAARVAAFKELKDVSSVAATEGEMSIGSGLPSVTIFLGSPDGPSVTVTPGRNADAPVEEAEYYEIPDLTPPEADE